MDLVERWAELTGERRLGEELVTRYREEHRRYHTDVHLAAVLDLVDELAADADDVDVVRLAAWFHDAVYDPQRGDNEERSAVLASRMLTDLGYAKAEEVADLVRMTKTHEPSDANGRVLCDADLAILAASPSDYAAYAAAVRQEYAFIPDEFFRPGRADVLEQLLKLPSLFHTSVARERFEARARANVQAEINQLRTSAV
jgi:predicted metal-dependent HD superfamily phosphohydrolase